MEAVNPRYLYANIDRSEGSVFALLLKQVKKDWSDIKEQPDDFQFIEYARDRYIALVRRGFIE